MAAEERERLMWQGAIRLMLLVDGPTGRRPFWYPRNGDRKKTYVICSSMLILESLGR